MQDLGKPTGSGARREEVLSNLMCIVVVPHCSPFSMATRMSLLHM